MKHSTHMVIDLETLDTKASAVVLSAGVVVFNKDKILDKSYIILDKAQQLRDGRTVSFSTLCWWMKQSSEARNGVFLSDNDKYSTDELLYEINDLHNEHNNTYVWGHGSIFDIGILDNISNQCDVPVAWKFYHIRDTRTLFDVLGSGDVKFEGEQHNALDDALYEAKCIQFGLNQL